MPDSPATNDLGTIRSLSDADLEDLLFVEVQAVEFFEDTPFGAIAKRIVAVEKCHPFLVLAAKVPPHGLASQNFSISRRVFISACSSGARSFESSDPLVDKLFVNILKLAANDP